MLPDRPITRRAFLAATSAAALVPMIPMGRSAALGWGPVATASSGAGAQVASPGATAAVAPMSVGYIDGSAELLEPGARSWSDAAALHLRQVIPATSVRPSAGELTPGTALVTVHGLVLARSGVAARALDSVALDADFRATDDDPELRFFAWTHRAGPAPATSGRSIFSMAVDEGSGLTFHLTTRSSGRTLISIRRLAILGGFGLATLRRGAYLLATRPGTWDRPRMTPAGGDAVLRDLSSVLVTIDRA